MGSRIGAPAAIAIALAMTASETYASARAWLPSAISAGLSSRRPARVRTSAAKYRERPVWAALQSETAELMVTLDGDPIDPAGQGVLFYPYSHDSYRATCTTARQWDRRR